MVPSSTRLGIEKVRSKNWLVLSIQSFERGCVRDQPVYIQSRSSILFLLFSLKNSEFRHRKNSHGYQTNKKLFSTGLPRDTIQSYYDVCIYTAASSQPQTTLFFYRFTIPSKIMALYSIIPTAEEVISQYIWINAKFIAPLSSGVRQMSHLVPVYQILQNC